MNKLLKLSKNKYFILSSLSLLVVVSFSLGFAYFLNSRESNNQALDFAWAGDNRLYYINQENKTLNILNSFPFFKDHQIETPKKTGQNLYGSNGKDILLLERFDYANDKYLSFFNTQKKEFTPFNTESPNLIYSFSLDGQFFAYPTTPNQQGKSTINIYSLDEQKLSTRGALPLLLANITSIDWSADGKSLYIATQPSDFVSASELYKLNLETRKTEILFLDSDSYTSFKIKSDQILFISKEGLYTYNPEKAEKKLIYEKELSPYTTICDWATEKKIICQILEEEGKFRNLYEINTKTEKISKLTSYAVENPYLAYLEFKVSPNGKKIAILNQDKKLEIVRVR